MKTPAQVEFEVNAEHAERLRHDVEVAIRDARFHGASRVVVSQVILDDCVFWCPWWQPSIVQKVKGELWEAGYTVQIQKRAYRTFFFWKYEYEVMVISWPRPASLGERH